MLEFSVLQSVYKNDNPVFLDECLYSLSKSTVLPKKILIVKDGLISETLESVLIKWKNELNIQIEGYNENMGLAHALNFGMKFIDTEFVARMDSDDIVDPKRFEEQLIFFEENPEAEICGTAIREFYINEDKKEHRRSRFYPEIVTSSSKTLYKGTPLGHPTLMIKTELLKKFQYSEATSLNEDIELWFRLIKENHVIYNLNQELLNFRITDSTFKRRSFSKAINEYKIYSKNLKQIFGFSILGLFPIIRLFTRFLPYKINKALYFSNIRYKMFSKKR